MERQTAACSIMNDCKRLKQKRVADEPSATLCLNFFYFFFFPFGAAFLAVLGFAADLCDALLPFGDDFPVFALAFGFPFVEAAFTTAFFFGADIFDFPLADAFTLPFFFPPSPFPLGDDVLCPFARPLANSTNFSTVQPTLTETTSSPGFTSTTTSPFVAARLRIATSSKRVDFGAPLVRWMVAI